MKYEITFLRKSFGQITVEANNREEAKEKAETERENVKWDDVRCEIVEVKIIQNYQDSN